MPGRASSTLGFMPEPVTSTDPFQRTPLHYAAADGELADIAQLLAGGADPQAQDAVGFTPLHLAAQEQQAGAVQLLLAAGADPDSQDRWGNTPLWRAVFTSHGDGAAVPVLTAGGSDLDAANHQGISPRHLQRLLRGLPSGRGTGRGTEPQPEHAQ
jgi:ankyrin repeat protein